MAGILDLLESPGTVVPAGPLNAFSPPTPEPTQNQLLEKIYKEAESKTLLDSISGADNDFDITQLDYPSMSEFLNEYKSLKRKDITPEYVYNKDYQNKKTSESLFTDSYDVNSTFSLSPKQIEKEYKDFTNIINQVKDEKYNLENDILYNEVFSPAGNNLIEQLQQYNQYHNTSGITPDTYKDLLMMTPPKGSA